MRTTLGLLSDFGLASIDLIYSLVTPFKESNKIKLRLILPIYAFLPLAGVRD